MKRKKNHKKAVYKVTWMGDNPLYTYEKYFDSNKEALNFSNGIQDPLVMKLANEKGNGLRWNTLPTPTSVELAKHITISRKLKEKFSNASGNTTNIVTTKEFSRNQKGRMFNALIFAPGLIYVGVKYALPNWIRVALVGTGVIIGYKNCKDYLHNRKLHKNIDDVRNTN